MTKKVSPKILKDLHIFDAPIHEKVDFGMLSISMSVYMYTSVVLVKWDKSYSWI